MTNPTRAVNPSAESIAALRALPDDDPIVMVNLLKYREPDGRKRYAQYGAVSGREIADRGGRVLYSGRSLLDSEWDSVVLVYYPRRAAWLDMQNSSAYQAAIVDRTAGLEKRLLFAFKRGVDPSGASAPPLVDVHKQSDDAVFVVSLLRYPSDTARREYFRRGQEGASLIDGADGKLEFFLTAELALVSDDDWEDFILVRYPSQEGLPPQSHRSGGLAGEMTIRTRQRAP